MTALADVPVAPESDEARRWVLTELSKAEYAQAQPTLIDRIAQAVWEWLQSLRFEPGEAPQGFGLLALIVLVLALLVAAYFIFGKPSLRRRSRVTGELFGADDQRDSRAIRRDAERHAAAGRWDQATQDIFRAIARSLAERTIVVTSPGSTAQDFATRAGRAFPEHDADLLTAASAFDDVRYLGLPGTEERYRALADLEVQLRTARPRLDPVRKDTAVVGNEVP